MAGITKTNFKLTPRHVFKVTKSYFYVSHDSIYACLICTLRSNLKVHCKVIIGRNPIEANANTVAIQLPGNPVAYIGKCFTPY